MKYFQIIFSFIAMIILLASCEEDFLQRTPLDQVTSVDYFKSPNDLKAYVNQYYSPTYFPKFANWGSDYGTDNQIGLNVDTRLEGTRTIATSGSIAFGPVRSINYFFDQYSKVKEKYVLKDYQQYLGEAHFFRALIYINLLKTYGDIQWVSTELKTSSPELYSPRDPRNIVVDKIIASLDTAAMYLTEDKTNGMARVNKWMALLIQSRIALYEGSWEKYHAGDLFGVSNPQLEKYFNKVVEATTQIMESGKYDLYSTGKPSEDYRNLFSLLDYSTNKEVMFWRKYDNELIRGDASFTNDRNFRMEFPTGNTITKELADAYLCNDGKPITGNPLFQGHTTLSTEMQNRDPRFTQTIATPDQVWRIYQNGTINYYSLLYSQLNTKADYNAPSGYVILKGYDPNMVNHVTQYEETPAIIYRYAEVLLNFAEAKAELGTITQADIDKSVKKLRDRVGMPNLIIAEIATDPKWDFPALSPLINEIRRERRIELSMEGFRWDDIARWAAADELIVGKRPKGFLASQVAVNPFNADANGYLDPFQKAIPAGYGFKIGRDYLNSIPITEITLNPALVQNPGWD
jgi:hypothetical protein